MMLFNSPVFLFFLLVVVCLFYALPRYRMIVLGGANAIFYAYAGLAYFALFLLIVSIIFLVSRFLRGRYGNWALACGLTIVLSNLTFFKYSMFLLENIERTLDIRLSLTGTSFEDTMIALPIGISFYSFQLIAYLIDVYRKKLNPSRTLFEFWVFISLFAHSAAGPILRGNDFIPQLQKLRTNRFLHARFKLGIAFILLGLFKKVIIVERIAPYVNNYFANGGTLDSGEAWVAAYLFSFQIYFDFSAYSEMAVGIGFLLGLKLDLNFKTPYLSASPAEFWRRWHITLSQWIRDYIFIPLGGSRVVPYRVYVNIIAAMAISGLWHGAAWTFIIWGFYHGSLSAGHRLYQSIIARLNLKLITNSRIYHITSVFIFFHLTVIGWVFFRANSFSDALHILRMMLTVNPLHIAPELYKLIAIIAVLYFLHILEGLVVAHYRKLSLLWQFKIPSILRGAIYASITILLMKFLSVDEASSFIYFQF